MHDQFSFSECPECGIQQSSQHVVDSLRVAFSCLSPHGHHHGFQFLLCLSETFSPSFLLRMPKASLVPPQRNLALWMSSKWNTETIPSILSFGTHSTSLVINTSFEVAGTLWNLDGFCAAEVNSIFGKRVKHSRPFALSLGLVTCFQFQSSSSAGRSIV